MASTHLDGSTINNYRGTIVSRGSDQDTRHVLVAARDRDVAVIMLRLAMHEYNANPSLRGGITMPIIAQLTKVTLFRFQSQ